MADENNVRLTGIRQIVRLRELLQKWQSTTTLRHKSTDQGTTSGIPPASNRRVRNLPINWESDEDACASPEPPVDVPKGYIPIYVGPEHRRFVIPTTYLGLPVFKLLLEKAEEEFGFDHQGALMIPCEIETFKYILQVMERHQKGLIDDGKPHRLRRTNMLGLVHGFKQFEELMTSSNWNQIVRYFGPRNAVALR